MRFKVAIASFLALVMLFTLAMPALAETQRGRLSVHLGDETKAIGRVVLTVYENNQMWADVTVKKLQPGEFYWATMQGSRLSAPLSPVGGVADDKGNWGGGFLTGPYAPGEAWFTVHVCRGTPLSSNGVATEEIWVAFP